MKINKIFNVFINLISIFLILLGLLSILVFRKYKGDFFSYPILWIVLGGISVFVGVFLLIYLANQKLTSYKNFNNDKVDYLKNNGDKYFIEFDKCDIVFRKEYVNERKKKSSRAYIYDSMYDNSQNNISRVNYQIMLKCSLSIDNKRKVFETRIFNISLDNLKLKMALKKGTYIYINKNKQSDFYFDLNFLNDDVN
tara:strand:+ start:9364 stop:9951 length:588 start_codon:yes stop_codon:yes gene_type:complete